MTASQRPVMRCVYVSPSLDEKIRTYAFRRKLTQNELIVEAVRKLLDEEMVETGNA